MTTATGELDRLVAMQSVNDVEAALDAMPPDRIRRLVLAALQPQAEPQR